MKKILIGVCGGIAAYKAGGVVSALRQDGYDIQVAMTPAACQFVMPLTFAALSQKEVRTDLFPSGSAAEKENLYPHLYPAVDADVFMVLPATADIIAKLAHGFGDDIVSASALSLKPECVRLFCPGMNTQMWNNPVVRENVKTLEMRGWVRIGPETGRMACGTEGEGRMAEPETIVSRITAETGR